MKVSIILLFSFLTLVLFASCEDGGSDEDEEDEDQILCEGYCQDVSDAECSGDDTLAHCQNDCWTDILDENCGDRYRTYLECSEEVGNINCINGTWYPETECEDLWNDYEACL